MKNEKIARRAYEDYELELQKEKELQELISAKREQIHSKATRGEIRCFNEILKTYDEINNMETQLENVRKNIDFLARVIIKYVFG